MAKQRDTYRPYLNEIESALKKAAPESAGTKYFSLQDYIGTKLKVSGLKIPEIRNLYKKGYSFSHLPDEEQYQIWKYIWFNAEYHDAMTQAILFCNQYRNKTDKQFFWKEMNAWLSRIDNWAHSDSLTPYFATLLEEYPEIVYNRLKEWNHSKNPWERRQSVLSLLDYARFRKKILPFKKIIALVQTLLDDEDYFVQKGVGWCLRETSIVYHKETLDWLRKNVQRLSSPAFATATEKISAQEKEKLKMIRKESRKNKPVRKSAVKI